MREIKFRAWDKRLNRWYKPTHEAYRGELFELFVGFGGDLSAHVMTGMEHESLWPDRFVLMQYTGLKDKNGVEIYEGDIVRDTEFDSDNYRARYSVVFEDGAFRSSDGSSGDFFKVFATKSIEVIGNIYENGDLLK